MKRGFRPGVAGLSIFEVLIAMGVFALAFVGLAMALDAAISAGLESRSVSQLRRELENRMAYCRVDPPTPGTTRTIEARNNKGIGVRESLEPYEAVTINNLTLTGLWTLKIEAEKDGVLATADTLLYIP